MEVSMMFVIFIPIAVMMAMMPYVTRKTESFGVTIPEHIYNDQELQKMRKLYAVVTVVFSLIIMVVMWAMKEILLQTIIFTCCLIAYLIGHFLIYLVFHYRMKALKGKRNWEFTKKQVIAVDTEFRKQKLIYSNAWFIIHVLVTAVTTVLTYVFYDRIPNRYPTHYDLFGNVTNWTEKSYSAVFELPAVQLFLTVLFVWMNNMIANSKQQLNVGNPEKSIQQNVRFRRRWSLFLMLSSLGIIVLFFFIQLSLVAAVSVKAVMIGGIAIIVLILIGSIGLSMITGQGGSNIKTTSNEENGIIGYDDDHYWKLGIFYFNHNDPSIWVEKRFGSGWTMNFAQPFAWLLLLVILTIPLLISLL